MIKIPMEVKMDYFDHKQNFSILLLLTDVDDDQALRDNVHVPDNMEEDDENADDDGDDDDDLGKEDEADFDQGDDVDVKPDDIEQQQAPPKEA